MREVITIEAGFTDSPGVHTILKQSRLPCSVTACLRARYWPPGQRYRTATV